MSNKVLNMVRDARIVDATAKEVLKVIADQCNDAGTGVWSSFAYIAWCIERSRSGVIAKTKILRDLNLLDRSLRTGTSNLWVINLDELERIGEPYREKIEVQTVDPLDDEVVQTVDQLVQTVDPSPEEPLEQELQEELLEEPEKDVIFPNGEVVPPNKICTRCGEAPKAPRAKLYCIECQQASTKEWEAKKEHMAVRSYEQRIPDYFLNESQVDLIIEAVGDETVEQKRWAHYLDRWLLNGWHIGQSGLANVVEAYKTRSLDDKVGGIIEQAEMPQYVTPEQLEAWRNRRTK